MDEIVSAEMPKAEKLIYEMKLFDLIIVKQTSYAVIEALCVPNGWLFITTFKTKNDRPTSTQVFVPRDANDE